MAVCSLGSALRAAPLVAHQRRTALAAVPAARRTLAVRAQKEESKDVAAPAQQQQQERAVGPARSSGYGTLDTLTPSWGRMNQVGVLLAAEALGACTSQPPCLAPAIPLRA